MTIADKFRLIADNSRALYAAGYAAGHIEGMDVRRVGFESWHNGVGADTLVAFEHGLGVKPAFVAFIPDDVMAIEQAELPSGISSVICQADAVYNLETNAYCPANFIRRRDGAYGSSARNIGDGSNRLIADWDDKYIYVNANGSGEAWPPASVTTYTLVCCSNVEARSVLFGICAGEVADNSIMKVQAIELSLEDWFTSDSQPLVIPHALGCDPDTIVMLPSHYGWVDSMPSEYYSDNILVAGMSRTWYASVREYGEVSVDYYDENCGGYCTTALSDPVIDWTAGWVRINPVPSVVLAPSDEVTYKLLVIKHT